MVLNEKALRRVGEGVYIEGEVPLTPIVPHDNQPLSPIVAPDKFDDRGDWSWVVGSFVAVPNRTKAHKQLVRKLRALNASEVVDVPKSVDIVVRHNAVEIKRVQQPLGRVGARKLRTILTTSRDKSAPDAGPTAQVPSSRIVNAGVEKSRR
jgi:hypothetical protein